MSRLERGLLSPPQGRDRLEEYAKYLGFQKRSDGWYTFLDMAAASQGRIPLELMENEKIVAKLPWIFRALRSKRLTNKQLDDLAKKVRAK